MATVWFAFVTVCLVNEVMGIGVVRFCKGLLGG